MFIIQVTVSDGLLKDNGNLKVHIVDANEPPILLNLPNTATINEDHTGYVFHVEADDQEATVLVYSVRSYPSSGDLLLNIDSTGTL